MSSDISIFRRGVPTKPDVDKLLAKFDVPREGELIAYAQIEEVIGVAKDSNRFGSVVGAWRKELRRLHEVEMRADPGVGFVCMNPDERIGYSVGKTKSGLRSINRGMAVAEKTDKSRLSPEKLKAANHLTRCGAALRLAAATAAKGIEFKIA